jgi:hypothetical protein
MSVFSIMSKAATGSTQSTVRLLIKLNATVTSPWLELRDPPPSATTFSDMSQVSLHQKNKIALHFSQQFLSGTRK